VRTAETVPPQPLRVSSIQASGARDVSKRGSKPPRTTTNFSLEKETVSKEKIEILPLSKPIRNFPWIEHRRIGNRNNKIFGTSPILG
jgi:hypothetical protein